MVRFDHGVISAVKYFVELEKLQNSSDGNYLDWPPNKRAALAIALHNFRYKKCDLSLSCKNLNTFIAYLLIVCDEIQEWERDRIDVDAELSNSITGKNVKKSTELIGIIFREKHAFVTIDHKLKYISLKEKFEEYLDEKILLLKKHYPIRVLFPQLRPETREELKATANELSLYAIAGSALWTTKDSFQNIGDGVLNKFLEIKPDTVETIKVSDDRLSRLKKISGEKTTKKLLLPSRPKPIYEIYINHRIEGDPFLTVVFPL